MEQSIPMRSRDDTDEKWQELFQKFSQDIEDLQTGVFAVESKVAGFSGTFRGL